MVNWWQKAIQREAGRQAGMKNTTCVCVHVHMQGWGGGGGGRKETGRKGGGETTLQEGGN